jgi:membrane protein implicated in regulation of membrane protease activity
MSPFWGSFSEQFRGSGRNATIFMLFVVALTFGVALASLTPLFQYAELFFAVLSVFIVIRICIACSKIRKHREEQSHRSPLSRDELRKARSKLVRNKTNGFSQNRY